MDIPKILVLGGYGAVGEIVSTQLAALYSGAVIIAGRDGKKAEALSRRLPGTTSLTIDARDPKSYAQIFARGTHVKVVLSCIELPVGSTLAHDVLSRGVHFAELTATFAAHKNSSLCKKLQRFIKVRLL